MSTLDRLFGRRPEPREESPRRADSARQPGPAVGHLTDDQAIERYRYLLRTAPPEALEQAHAEAFAQLTAAQRRQVLEGLSRELPARERTDRDDPQSLARLATRVELRRPGTLERTFSGLSLGGLLAVDFLSTVAGVVVGSAIADAIFNAGGQGELSGTEAADGNPGAAEAGYDSSDAGYDIAGDFDGVDFGGEF